jgi:hydrogenase expression/formation protein HypE
MAQDASGWGSCPVTIGAYDHVVLGHGSGGRLSHELVNGVFLPAFRNETLAKLEDQATVELGTQALAMTTDAFVVRPLFFPGGDIGSLAVHGTVNDLAVGGAVPRWLTASFILEEGLPLATLKRIVESMRRACEAANVEIVAGDTKVVERGKGDGVFITTTGVGVVPPGPRRSVSGARPGDSVIVSGTLGDHGITILSAREGMALASDLVSDSAALTPLVRAMLEVCSEVRCMRDPTRGGLASALNEIASASRAGIRLDEDALPVRREVAGACELLGLDPLYVANEGKLVAVVPREHAARLLGAMKAHPLGRDAACVGEVVEDHPGKVTLRSSAGGARLVLMLAGEQLPRIC